MIAEMVIAIAYAYIECYSTEQLSQVSINVSAATQNEIHNIQIAVPVVALSPSFKPSNVIADAK